MSRSYKSPVVMEIFGLAMAVATAVAAPREPCRKYVELPRKASTSLFIVAAPRETMAI